MRSKILVRVLLKPVFVDSSRGASLIGMVFISGMILFTVANSIHFMSQRKTYFEILRMQSRLDLLEKKIENAAQSMQAMEISARAAGTNSDLYRCVIERDCRESAVSLRFQLFNPGRQKLSGKKNLSGENCTGDCPIQVDTRYQIICGEGRSTCLEPAEILTEFRIRKASSNYFGNRKFENRIGTYSLSTFVCDDGEYISSISSEGVIFCDKAIASRFNADCPAGTSAFGLSPEGLLKCIPIVDYCVKPINVAYVIDTSGSMKSQGKIGAAKNSTSQFVGKLKNGDRGSLVSFDSSASIRQNLSRNFNDLSNEVTRLNARGQTNMSMGLSLGAQTLAGAPGENIMIFLSDGNHNAGNINPVDAAQSLKNSGIRIISIGYGRNADRNMLMQIASSNGDYFDAVNVGDINKVLDNIAKMTCRN